MYANYVKRGIDVVGAFLLLLAAWPFMMIAAIAIKIEDPKGPVLFKQERPGKDEKIFTIYKFRTMKVATHDANGKRLSDMERMTKTGKILRKISLDEFPQFINVLKGDMSFIGPRPLLVMRAKLDLKFNEVVYIGDNLKKDFIGAKSLNILTVQIENTRGMYLHIESNSEYEADYKISSLDSIKSICINEDRR